jgi:hypothetical protein
MAWRLGSQYNSYWSKGAFKIRNLKQREIDNFLFIRELTEVLHFWTFWQALTKVILFFFATGYLVAEKQK